MILRDCKVLGTERGITRSYCVENWLWKRLWTGRKADGVLNELIEKIFLFSVPRYFVTIFTAPATGSYSGARG